jgi:Tol biopolymer transport system component
LIIAATAAGLFLYNRAASTSGTDKKGDLTVTRLTNTNYVRDAMISPDGNFFVYNEDLGESSRVWLQQTGTSTRKEILPGGRLQVCCKTFTPDGKFIYFLASGIGEKRNALYRIATLGGTPEKILDGVNSTVSFSPNGEQMAFLRYLPEQKASTFVIAASDGKGDQREVYRADLYTVQAPAWSPDGKKIAFASPTQDPESPGVCMLQTLDLETREVNPISDERWGTCFRIAWLRDGSGFAMVGTRVGETNSSKRDQVYLISYPGGTSRRLTTEGSRHEPDSLGVTNDGAILAVPYNRSSQIWAIDAHGDSRTAVQLTSGTADGRGSIAPLADGRVAYTARSGDGLNIWIMNGDGSNQTQIGDAAAVQDLKVTPDGKYFIYSNEIDQYCLLYRIGIDGSNPVALTRKEEFAIDSTVSPDGTLLVYDVWKTNGRDHDTALKMISINGGEGVTLSSDNCSVPHFSPDGAHVSCVYFTNSRVGVLSTKDGSKVAEFETVNPPLLNAGANWTPDGEALVYIVHQKNVCNIWKQPIEGGEPQQLTDFTNGACYNLSFSLDGSRLYIARGDELRDAILIKNYD